ncbi:protein SLOW GREEN 1, chloroplastic [Sesamum angolense]|uniref:Protein SLOW GREEN 1, chloroplastic n=1 Tax=Sesamum angolense TaxID=2727404 RepID=A0AAE2BSL8_9LAMI|nr:protein SLOW GREEN 1, chloroplastic [Sesamum angolense]
MELEPEEVEWPMMRAHLYAYNGELELAKNGFNELLMKDPFRVEAYHGLEEPRDFRPYLCQGIIYTLLRKNGEAEKNFEKYRRLVPKGHPYLAILMII